MHSRLGPGNHDEKSITPTRRHNWKVGKPNAGLVCQRSRSLLDIYPEKTIVQKDTCTPIFIADLFAIVRIWNQPKYPSTD